MDAARTLSETVGFVMPHLLRYPNGSVAQIPCWDSFRESSVVAGRYEQTDTPDLQDQELASLQ